MANVKSPGTIIYDEFIDVLEDYSYEERGMILWAVLMFATTGEETEFEDRGMRSSYKSIKASVVRSDSSYKKRLTASENGKKGGAPQGNQNARKHSAEEEEKTTKTTKTTENNQSFQNNLTERNVTKQNETKRNVAEAECPDGQQPHPLPELAQEQIDHIIDIWNSQDVTQNIKDIRPMSTRYDNVRRCIAYSNLKDFVQTIFSLDSQAYFKECSDDGNKLKFDRFTELGFYQKIIEGNYKDKWESKKTFEEKIEEDMNELRRNQNIGGTG